MRDTQEYEDLEARLHAMEAEGPAVVDWPEVTRLCLFIIGSYGKDLGVGCWLAYALFRVEGYRGLAVGLGLLREMIGRHWATMQPPVSRKRARIGALEWLAGRAAHLCTVAPREDDASAILYAFDYEPFETFRHDLPEATASRPFFKERLRPATVGRGIDHFLSFVTPHPLPAGGTGEVVSVALTCTNGSLAERLSIGMIDQPTSETPATVRFANVMGVTPHTPPPVGESLLWRLISNLARNFSSLADVGALRTLIASYDFRALHDLQAHRRLELLQEAIEDFTHDAEDAVILGHPMRVRTLLCTVAEDKIGGEAELFLFGSVLERFFTVYASVNTLHRFTIRGRDSKVEYRWKPRTGTDRPL
ncbi:type VI secretion system baseplate subunit TssF [Methylobacterium komagatae]|uniref:Type VI secretion system baseplate subunit TssF n=1 Tax=Methylobacterium komagatae TaxID=374425 RepID=A0ABW2BNV0_9HYPH